MLPPFPVGSLDNRWTQIASRSRKLAHAGSNLGGRAVAVVAAVSTVCAIIFITLGVLGLDFIMAAFGAGLIVIFIVVYFIGAAKLAKAIGPGNETGLRVVRLTRQVAGIFLFNTLVSGSWVVLPETNAFLAARMVIANFLMPVGYSATLLLLTRFIRSSFVRQETKSFMLAKKRAGTRSTASVAPATDFTESSTKGAAATNGGSTTAGV